MIGAGGHLSGPFLGLDQPRQAQAVLTLLQLPDHIGLPEPRLVVPAMANLALRHPRLSLLHLEAVAAGRTLGATVWLSNAAASGILPAALDAEGVDWQVVEIC